MLYDKYKNVMGQHVTWRASTASGLGGLPVSSLFYRDKKIPLVQACSLGRKTIENLKKTLKIEYTLIVQILL